MIAQGSTCRAMHQVKDSKLVNDVETLGALAGLLNVRRNSLKQLKLFDTQTSGWSNVPAFHSSCDTKGPTIVLIRSSDGNSYGGYTSVSWATANVYREDAQAFLFRMCPEAGQGSRQRVRTEKFPVAIPTHAQLSSASHGPTFGGGNDLQTFTTSGLALSTNPYSYPTEHPLINTSVPKTEANFQLEVLQVIIDPNGAGELEMPWLTEVTWAVKVGIVSL